MTTVGELIHKARLVSGFTLRDVAEIMGLSHTTVHAWESGSKRLPLDRLGRLSDVIGADREELYQAWRYDQVEREHIQGVREDERRAARRQRAAA